MNDSIVTEAYFGQDNQYLGRIQKNRLYIAQKRLNVYDSCYIIAPNITFFNKLEDWYWWPTEAPRIYTCEKTAQDCATLISIYIKCIIPPNLIEILDSLVVLTIMEGRN